MVDDDHSRLFQMLDNAFDDICDGKKSCDLDNIFENYMNLNSGFDLINFLINIRGCTTKQFYGLIYLNKWIIRSVSVVLSVIF